MTQTSDHDPLILSTPSRRTSDSLASPYTPAFVPISPSISEPNLRRPYSHFLDYTMPQSMSNTVNIVCLSLSHRLPLLTRVLPGLGRQGCASATRLDGSEGECLVSLLCALTHCTQYGLLDASVYPGPLEHELDDDMHEPDPMRDASIDHGGTIFSTRGLVNLGCLSLLMACILGLLYVWNHRGVWMKI